MNPKLKMLCELYNRSDKNIDLDALLKVCFFKDEDEILILLTKKQLAKFACLCAKSTSHLIDWKINEKTTKLLNLIEKWIESPNVDLSHTLRDAAYITYSQINYASSSLSCAAFAIFNYYKEGKIGMIYYVDKTAAYSIKASEVENRKEQEYKVLGFLVKVIRDG